ncbi:MAG: hypothetical protein MH252_04750 [Thermosynechococcaceae cyanobacterium MS004]|nr:hypothetical protein [Thermosynechococcaceae cyanobacterium MS004]
MPINRKHQKRNNKFKKSRNVSRKPLNLSIEQHPSYSRSQSNKSTNFKTFGLIFLGFLVLSFLGSQSNERSIKGNQFLGSNKANPPLEFYSNVLPSFKKPSAQEINGVGLWQKDYRAIDYYGRSISYNGKSVNELAKALSSYAYTSEAKARIAYVWITNNISYDVQSYLSQDYKNKLVTPESVLRDRTAVCSGYSELYEALGKAMGLDVITIEGYAKGADYALGASTDVNHAWNAVKIDGYWYVVDATWGAGTLESNQFKKQFNPFFFAPPPAQFVYTHLPVVSEWQLLAKPYTKDKFENLPEVSTDFFEDGLRTISHNQHTISIKDAQQVLIEVPTGVEISARYQQVSSQSNDTSTLGAASMPVQVHQHGNQVLIPLTPWMNTYQLNVYSRRSNDSSTYYDHAISYRVVFSPM